MKCVCLMIVITMAASVAGVSAAGKKWLVYEKCELVDDKYFDGDSFSVRVQTGYTYVFRLYGVDCPETDKRVQSRLLEQAKAFRIEEKEVLVWGKKASRFSKNFLRKPFTVYTRKLHAGGASNKNRYYALIVNAEGKRLDEALLEVGLARAYGKPADWDQPFWGERTLDLPRKMDERRFMIRLRILESKAKSARVGVWEG